MITIANDWLLETSRWLWDYYLMASVLLAVVLVTGMLIAQPARRMAIHWSAAAGLVLLALLCAVPGWSVVHMISTPPEASPSRTEPLEPMAGPAIQIAKLPPHPYRCWLKFQHRE
jgi:uncharacterized membrane protein